MVERNFAKVQVVGSTPITRSNLYYEVRMQNRFDDIRGMPMKVGDRVARAFTAGRAAMLKIATITRIENGKMYLDDSKVALNYPSRLLVVNALGI